MDELVLWLSLDIDDNGLKTERSVIIGQLESFKVLICGLITNLDASQGLFIDLQRGLITFFGLFCAVAVVVSYSWDYY